PNGGNSGNGSINAAHYGAHVNRTAINDTNTNPKSFLSDDSNGGLYIYDIGHPEDDYTTFSVTMIGVLEPPLLYQPIEDDIDVLVTPSFSWKRVNVAEKYELQIALDEDFEEIVFVDNEIEDTDYDADIILNLETEHYWRVRTFDGDDWSEWSSQRKFITTHFSPIEAEFTGVAYASTLWGDFDNDGYLDLFTSGNNITTIYQNKGDGDFEALPLVFPKLRFVAAALGDLNNDGYLDIVLTGRDQANAPCAYIFLNNGDDTFTELENNLEGVYNGSVDFGDFNNDGWLDILITGESKEGKSVAIYKNNGDYTYTKLDTENLPGITMGGAVWGDFDNDGWLDIAITGSSKNGSVSEIYLNDKGEGSFTKLDSYFTPLQGSCIDVADFDKDGFLDLALSGTTSGGLATYIYRNNGDGTFTDLGVDIPGYAVGNVKWGDLEGNGYPDLLLSGFTRTAIYRNVEGRFTLVNSGLPTLSLSSADWGDFDNDGDLDIVISGSALEGMVLTVYRNELGKNEFQPNTPPSAPENLTTVSNDSATTLSWDIAEDEETPADALTYNISIGSESGLEDILSSLSDLETGYRRVIKQGNNSSRLEYTIENLPPGTYYWRVQAIDSAFSGSPFSVEQEFSIEEDSAVEIPGSPFITELIGNYPNPFNPSTTVQFSLKNEEKVEVAVYNIAGQKIRTILNDTLESGKHTISWNGKTDNNKEVGSGIYFYKLTTQEKTQTKKMLLLK
ncbi:MAG: FG-GAP-like repeat-containing protein, partial [Candidatus Cloacimonas sp.]|nr:FG-GAP-like repeat-containing protein [Candidatus Cloacimonadota bacterium]